MRVQAGSRLEGSILRKCHVAVTKITRSYLDIWLKTFISHDMAVPTGHVEDKLYVNALGGLLNTILQKKTGPDVPPNSA